MANDMSNKDRVTKLEICSRHNWDDISETQRANIINAAYDDGMTDEEKAAVDAAILLDCATKREANRRLKPKQRKR